MSHYPAINLDPFAAAVGCISTNGVEYDVLGMTGRQYREFQTGQRSGDTFAAFDLAAKLVPSLGDGVYDLNGAQIGAIIAIAGGVADRVETIFPNSPGPTPPNEHEAPAPLS